MSGNAHAHGGQTPASYRDNGRCLLRPLIHSLVIARCWVSKEFSVIEKVGLAAMLLAASVNAHAGVKWLSRANCVLGIVNESVTYDRPSLASHYMVTHSEHVGFGAVAGHSVSQPLHYTWRSYAGDRGDATRNTVRGTHIFGDDFRRLTYRYSTATDCNLGEW
jgi:hypothetical protein